MLRKISLTPGRPGAAAVVDATGKLVGVFTDGNLRRCLETGRSFLDAPISSVMGRSPKSITAERFAKEALALLVQLRIDQLLVVDSGGSRSGMVNIQDVGVVSERPGGGSLLSIEPVRAT